MHFYDRPARRKIALRGSSSRPPTSQELLARAKKAREQRARRREEQNAASTLQAAFRQRAAVQHLAQSLTNNTAPTDLRHALVQLLLLSGVLSTSNTSLSANITLVIRNVTARPFLPAFANRLVHALHAEQSQPDSVGHQLNDLPQSMIVKCIVVLFAIISNHLTNESASRTELARDDIQNMLLAAKSLNQHLTHVSLQTAAQWGFFVHAGDLLRLLANQTTYTACCDIFRELLLSTIQLTDREGASQVFSTAVHRHFALSLFAIDNVTKQFPLVERPELTTRLIAAAANLESSLSEDGFVWDGPSSYSSLDAQVVAVVLSNVLEAGNYLWHAKQKDALWSFVAIISTLVHLLPVDYIDPDLSDADDEMNDASAVETNGPAKSSMRMLMTRLRASFKFVVSEEIVRNVFSAAAAEGQEALIRACKLFTFLIKHEKSLGLRDPFLGSLAFWRGSRSEGSSHILNILWNNCKTHSSDSLSGTTEVQVILAEEATPILSVFASAYAYLLFIQDGDELFEANWPFNIAEVREIAQVMKQYLFSALYVTPVGRLEGGSLAQTASLLMMEHNLMDDVAKLLSRLYMCDSQRSFRTGDDFWLAGRGALSSDTFVQDAIQAGPNALTQSGESSYKDRDARQTVAKINTVAGAGELLRVAPYLVPFSTRAKIFQSWIARERDLANGGQSFFSTDGRTVAVRRKMLFEDAFQELNGLGTSLKSTIRVKFIDEHGLEEAGIDGGGVYKEFMHEVLKLGFSPYLYGLFKAALDGRLYPNPDAAVANENFRTQFAFLGRLLGKAVFDGVLVNIPLASFFLSKMLGQFSHPIDLGSLDPELYKNMKYLQRCPPSTVEDLGLNFTVANNAYGTTKEVQLMRNGRNIPVTASNRIEYMHRVANYRMNTQIKEQCTAFLRGFSEVVPSQFIRLFSREELQLLISGKTGKIDLDDLRRNTKYSGGYDESTPVIRWFWEAMGELSPEEQGKMLQFVTSSPRAPLLGFSYLVPGFCIHRAEGEVRLPTASTCMNLLKLPKYKSLDVVREKLRYALASNAGFDLS